MATTCGGYTAEAQEPNDDVHKLVAGVKGDVEKHLGTSHAVFEAKQYKTQVVAGTNYKVKVHVGDDKYVHVAIHEPLPFKNEPPKLLSAEGGKTASDSL